MRIRSGNAAQAVQRKNTKISEAISFARYKEDERKDSAIAAIATRAAQRNTARTRAAQRNKARDNRAISFAQEEERKISAIAAVSPQAKEEDAGKQEARRKLHEHMERTLREYTLSSSDTELYYKDSQGASTFSSPDTKLYYFGSLDENKEHETLFEMQATMQNRADFDDEPQFFDAVSDFSSGSQTTIGTQTYWSFGPNLW